MASTNWEKYKTGEAQAMIRHDDTQERLLHEHDNKEIDKAITPFNVDLLGGGYPGACKRLTDRLAALDAAPGARNRRKDRVIALGLETAVPEGIAGDKVKEDAWAADYLQVVRDRYRAGNVVSAYLHRDEAGKKYIDEDGEERVSRAHVHIKVVPEVDGRLNARALVTRQEMIDLNRAVEAMTRDKYGCAYMTGKGRKGRSRSVERLKSASAQRAAEMGALEMVENLQAEREADRQEALAVLSEAGAEAQRYRRLADKTRAEWVTASVASGQAEASRQRMEDLERQWEQAVREQRGLVRRKPDGTRPQSPAEQAARAKVKPLQEATREAVEGHAGAAERILAQAEEWQRRDPTKLSGYDGPGHP